VAPEGYHSEIVVRYERCSKTQDRLLARLYLEGLASGDFEPVFRAPWWATTVTGHGTAYIG
jgi:hypothetical protein